jgi:hypothetical protein
MLKERKVYPRFRATAHGGKIYFEDEPRFSEYLLGLEGKTLEAIVRPEPKIRSRQEEKYYHAVVVRMVAEAMGLQDDTAHDFLKNLFLKEEVQTPGGARFTRVLSTTELDDKAYRDYWERCVRWAAQATNPAGLSSESGLELYIPLPGEVAYENY